MAGCVALSHTHPQHQLPSPAHLYQPLQLVLGLLQLRGGVQKVDITVEHL
jgi:hypothetical protein